MATNVATRAGVSDPTRYFRSGVEHRRFRLVPLRRVVEPFIEDPHEFGDRSRHTIDREAGAQPSEEGIVPGAVFLPERLRNPDARRWIREPEAARHDPDDGSRLSVDAEPLADDQPVGAELLPEPVAEHRDRLGTALVLALLEAAA